MGDAARGVSVSNLGQAVLIVAGTVIGAYFGNPQLGFALGALAGSELFPTQLPSGPKLTDNRTTTSNVGDPVPIGFGTFTVAGTVIWLAPFVQHSNQSGGKGGPSQTTYSYTQSIAIGLAESAVDLGQAISGILRIWESGTIVFDVRPQQQANSFTGQVAETDQQYANRLAASALYADTFTLYLGSETQNADPTIEAVEGFGNVPAFRGLAYIVYPNRVLQTAQGWRHPNFTFECSNTATPTVCNASLLLHFDGNFADSSSFSHTMTPFGDAAASGGALSIPDTSTSTGGSLYTPIVSDDSLDILSGNDDFTIEGFFKLSLENGTNLIIADYGNDRATFGGVSGILIEAQCSAPGVGYLIANTAIPGWSALGGSSVSISAGTRYHFAIVRWNGVTSLYFNGVSLGNSTNWSGYSFPATSYLSLGWSATISGGLNPGFIYEVRVMKGCALYRGNFTPPTPPLTAGASLGGGTASPGAPVSDIIQTLCGRASVANIDVSDLTAIYVDGYSISSISNATNSIQPLRSIAFFDAVESAGMLCFRARGKPIVATLTLEQIGAFDGGSSGANVPPSVTVARVDETTLPRSIRLHYKSVNRDYLDNQQSSPFRLTTRAINDQDIALPFCLEDSQALQCAEILWSDSWAAKNTYTVAVDQSLSEIEVGDAIGIPVDGFIQRARIVSEQNSSAVLRKLSLVSDNDGSYISFAIAEVSQVAPAVLTLLTGTMLELLDLPALLDSDNNAGFYIAAQRTGPGNAWKGCTIYKSIDGGSTWASLFSMVVEATYGTLSATPAASQFFTWDDVTTITVDLSSSAFSLESRTDDAVLAGANAAAIGRGGRWEVIQFANATQLSSTQWRLSRLLRGRRGTEHNIGKSVAGDAFVILSTGDLSRVVLQTTEIGALREYDAPSIGASFSSGIVYPFTGQAMALRPFSPVDANAVLESDGDILIRWIRRDRLGGTLMSGVDMPLSEATLAFELDILNSDSPDSPITAIRTLSTTATHVTYTAAQQFADFGSAAPTQLGIAIYQMSAVVGRGIPLITTITIGASP